MRAWLGGAFVSMAAMAHAAEMPGDFAYAMPIIAAPGETFYQVELPPALYRGIAHADLRDIRVFNAKDEMVPHALRAQTATTALAPETAALPFFPLRGEPTRDIGELRVRVHKRADGTLVDIRSDGKPAGAAGVTRGYLLDASRAQQGLRALLFDWNAPREGYSAKVRVEGSDDLVRWNTVVNEAPLLDLEFGGHRLEMKRVQFRTLTNKYLRVSWPQGQKAVNFTSVRAESVPATREAERTWVALAAPVAGKQPGEFQYDLGGLLPFDRMRIELPQANTVANMEILAREKSGDEWRPLGTALVYRLQREGSDVTSPEIRIASRGQRALLLRVDQKGGGIGNGTPTVHLGWIPRQLVFAARGEGPFRLAYGSHAARDAAFSMQSLLPGYGSERAFAVKPAKLGEPVALAGEKQLRAPVDYKRWVLWASLILGVAVLGAMAYRLLRQMARTPPTNAPPDRNA
jgi:hypothetical protein